MKKKAYLIIRHLPKIVCAAFAGAGLMMYPEETAGGIRDGIILLTQAVIPSLFPFLVLSSYITSSGIADMLSAVFKRIIPLAFRVNGYAFTPILLGLCGGYPVGAKTISESYKDGKLTANESERLLYWCVNPGPAFTVTAVGLSMLGSIGSGIILYVSLILSSLTIGFFCRFLSDRKSVVPRENAYISDKKYAFVSSVSSVASAMFNISAWVLTFSCIGALVDTLSLGSTPKIIVKAALEVTTGCRAAAGNVSLPVTAAMLGFGGFSVICQILPYLDICHVELKRFISARVINSALTALFASQLVKLFPESVSAATVINAGSAAFSVSATIPATIILLIMCAVLIFEVDNKKKVC